MKNLITIINLSIIIGITTIFTQSDKLASQGDEQMKRSVKAVNAETSALTSPSKNSTSLTSANDETTEFLYEMTEARLMDLEEGKTAAQRGTTRALKDYGVLMVKDQTEMLKDLKKIAEGKHIQVPLLVGEEKRQGLEDLRKVHGKDFDKKFIKMMINDHKRDVRKFEAATHSNDADLQVFATKYLPIVEAHLIKIKALKKDLQ
jgi:putative membrane protein